MLLQRSKRSFPQSFPIGRSKSARMGDNCMRQAENARLQVPRNCSQALPALGTAIEGRIAVENLLNALGVDLNLEAAPFELEQHG